MTIGTLTDEQVYLNKFNRYLFSSIWNDPGAEYRKNIIPGIVASAAIGRVRLKQVTIPLPTETDTYIVYTVPTKHLGGISFRAITEWSVLTDFLERTRLEIRVHTEDGIMLPRGYMYVLGSPELGSMLLAVNKSMFSDILGRAFKVSDVIVALYYDSDIDNNITIVSEKVGSSTDIYALYSACENATMVFLNGHYAEITSIDDIVLEDLYVEAVTDSNVIDSFSMDLAMTGDRRNFTSLIDGRLKAIIHIPKAINPDNRIISHHTCDVFVLPRNIENGHLYGKFLHRAIRDYQFTQITHNDFAIPEVVLNAYTGALNTDEITLVVYVRTQSKNNVLIPDKNYIHLLYTHTDEEILDYFEGEGLADFSFWRADHLENSIFSKMISDVPNILSLDDMDDFIDAIGYYNSIAYISTRIYRTTVPNENIYSYLIPTPAVLYTTSVTLIVSVNGIKLPDDKVTIRRVQDKYTLMDIDASVELAPGDKLVVELFEDLPHGIVKAYPSAGIHTVGLASNTFVVYEVQEPTLPVQGVERTYTQTFIKQNVDDIAYVTESDGRYILTFKSETYGKQYVIAYDEGISKHIINIDSALTSLSPVEIDLKTTISQLAAEPPFVLDTHTEPTSSTGTLIETTDPDAESEFPAWHLMNRETGYEPEHRWRAFLSLGGATARYTLDAAYQGNVWMIGFKIGAMPDPYDSARAATLPINYDVVVDGVIVKSIRNEIWYRSPEAVHTHMLPFPVRVDATIELRILGVQTGSVLTVSVDLWEPIFGAETEVTEIPIAGDITAIAYLNGKELVPDVDFMLADIQDPAVDPELSHFSGRQFVLNNASYLVEPSGNLLEVFITHNTVVGKEVGFLQRSILGAENANPMWYSGLSNVAVDGYCTENISELYGSVEVDTDVFRMGAPYIARTVLPPRGKRFIDRYHEDDDRAVIDQLVPYFRARATPPPDMILLPYSHRIASVFLTSVVRDILNGTLVIGLEPSDEALLAQLADYDYLRQYDAALNPNSAVDLNYVDVQPTFVEVVAPSPTLWTIITNIVRAVHTDNVAHRRPDQE